MMSTARDVLTDLLCNPGVYAPQDDSILMCEQLMELPEIEGARVLDLGTGSGILAYAAATLGARRVYAYDICAHAVHCARANATRLGVRIEVRAGTLTDALEEGPFDVVVSNPPYVPSPYPPVSTGLQRAWDAGRDGRLVLDPLCRDVARLLSPGGVMLLVHSEFADVDRSLELLRAGGATASVIACRQITFGPVLNERAPWLEAQGLLEPGRRTEELVVIRAQRGPW